MVALNAGDSRIATLTVDPADGTTAATLTVIAPDGTTTTPEVTATAGNSVWTAEVTYATAGLWTLLWEVTGTGRGVETQTVEVLPAAPVSGRAYATTADLAEYLTPLPDQAGRLLVRASRLVDRALLCAVYDVDDDGMPTDARVAAALREATCEQVTAWVAGGEDGTGTIGQYQSVSIGSVSLTRAAGGAPGGGSASAGLCSQAWMILQQAGLTGRGPYVDPVRC